MRKIIIVLLFVTVTLSAQKNVLIEVFTNSHCSVCVNGHTALNNFFQSTSEDDRYIEIYYHMVFPYNDDPLNAHNSADANVRNQYYGPFFFTPIGFFDGEQQPGGSYNNWGSTLTGMLAESQTFDITLSGSKTDDNFTIDATVNNISATDYSNLKINYVVVEDVVYTGRNGISNHENVMRKIVNVPGATTDFNAGESKNFSATIDYNQAWNKLNLSVVVFVQGANKMVYQADEIQNSEIITTGVEDGTKPAKFGLNQNYPNPFNPSTTITYSLDKNEYVRLSVYDVLGNEVATLIDGEKTAGEYKVNYDAAGLSSGIYFYSLVTASSKLTRKMILLQ